MACPCSVANRHFSAHDWIHAAVVFCNTQILSILFFTLMTGYMQLSRVISPILRLRKLFVTRITSRRICSLSGVASINPASLALAVSSSSLVKDSQFAGKNTAAILSMGRSARLLLLKTVQKSQKSLFSFKLYLNKSLLT